jgi:tetratricopeptide (TPR) repeat protein
LHCAAPLDLASFAGHAQGRQGGTVRGYPRFVSPRTRVRVIVGAAVLAAAGIAVGATMLGRGGDEGNAAPRASRGAPGLELSVILRNDAEARGLRRAERAYDSGHRRAARKQFNALLQQDPESVEAAVGAAVAGWPTTTLFRLRQLAVEHPRSALVYLHLGLALYASGDDKGAATEWRRALEVEPDTPSAIRAEDLLHPEMAPGRPFFYPSFGARSSLHGDSPAEQLAELRKSAETGGVRANLLYGVALQRVGRFASAREAFARARSADARSLDAQVAEAVGDFSKGAPSDAFSRLGPLAASHPRSPVVRFHLGLLLLWIRNVDEARRQLQRAADADRGGFYGKEARALLSRLEAIGT